MKFLLISPKNRTVYNFRGDLIKEISALNYTVIATGPDQTDVDKIIDLGVDFREISMNKNGTSIIGDLKYCSALYKLIKSEKPDVVLGYTIKPIIYGSIAAKLAKVKNINSMITGVGFVFTSKSTKARILNFIVKILYSISLKCNNNIIFQNKDDCEEFLEKKLAKKEKCHIVNGSGINMSHFTPKPIEGNFNFLMISRLLKSKGVLEYLAAAKIVKEKYPEVEFSLLGKIEEIPDCIPENIVTPYLEEDIVTLHGETSDVRPFYEKCSIYVLPSYREGVPRTVLEAMAMGRPIITTDTNGCRETVIDGENGYLIPVGNSDILAEKMIYMIEHKEILPDMSARSIEICENKFDVNIVNKKMLSIMGLE